jgi:hypothetical protein
MTEFFFSLYFESMSSPVKLWFISELAKKIDGNCKLKLRNFVL